MELRPHDLVRLRTPTALTATDPAPPAWVAPSLAAAPFAVVRRCAAVAPGMVPVGVRGRTRSERHAAQVPVTALVERIMPEHLVLTRSWERALRSASIPALAALAAAADWLDGLGLPWGPVGGVGFELATGVPVLGAGSDLDLLLRADAPPDRVGLRTLASRLATLPARCDVQVELAAGAVALGELVRADSHDILLRTAQGPRLVARPAL